MSKSMFNAPHFQSPEEAREYLEGLRWGADRACPHCGTINESFATKKPGVYRCRSKECRKDFSVTTKSVMESSHIKLNVWLQAFFLMASSKKGVSSHQLHRTLGITINPLGSLPIAFAKQCALAACCPRWVAAEKPSTRTKPLSVAVRA